MKIDLVDGASSGTVRTVLPVSPCGHDPVPKVHCSVCPAKADEHCDLDCMAQFAIAAPTAPPVSSESASAFAVLPIEPTPSMQQAGVLVLRDPYYDMADYARVCAMYRAMLAAAPPGTV